MYHQRQLQVQQNRHLENQYLVWRKSKKQKLKDGGKSVVEGIKNIFK